MWPLDRHNILGSESGVLVKSRPLERWQSHRSSGQAVAKSIPLQGTCMPAPPAHTPTGNVPTEIGAMFFL